MTPEQIQQVQLLILGLAGPLSGLGVAWISSRRSKRQLTQEQATASTNAQVSEKDAHTREIAMILDGYTKVNEAQVKAIERAEKSANGCAEKYDALEKRFDEAEERHRREREESERRRAAERAEMIEHIRALEIIVPTPPGPPPRPPWN